MYLWRTIGEDNLHVSLENQGEGNHTCTSVEPKRREPYIYSWRTKEKGTLHVSLENQSMSIKDYADRIRKR